MFPAHVLQGFWKGNCVFFLLFGIRYLRVVRIPREPRPVSWRNSGLTRDLCFSNCLKRTKETTTTPKEISTQVEHLSLEISSFETQCWANGTLESRGLENRKRLPFSFIKFHSCGCATVTGRAWDYGHARRCQPNRLHLRSSELGGAVWDCFGIDSDSCAQSPHTFASYLPV